MSTKMLTTARRAALSVAAAALLAPMSASAALYSFERISSNATENVAGQLFMEVTSVGSQAAFTFSNIGSTPSFISDIYFDDGTLLGIATITGSTGVAFTAPANPPNLPGGRTIGFEVTQLLSADADNPSPQNGVNQGTAADHEWVTILFNLQSGKFFSDVITALDLFDGITEDPLRVGLHVQGIGTRGDSDGFVNTGCIRDCDVPDDQGSIPEPGTLALLGLGLMGLAARARKVS